MSAAVTLLTAYGVLAGRSGAPGRREQAVFTRINDGDEHRWLRVPQQWGTPWTLPAVAALAAARGRRSHAAATAACLPVVKGIEVATKKLRPRPRPLYVQPTVLRDDAPVEGGSIPSGHAAIAACGTVLLLPLLPRWAAASAFAVTALSAVARVRQGAHEPVDVVAGLLLGSGIGLTATELARRIG